MVSNVYCIQKSVYPAILRQGRGLPIPRDVLYQADRIIRIVGLLGFTAFAETSDPEEIMGVLREYHVKTIMTSISLAESPTLQADAARPNRDALICTAPRQLDLTRDGAIRNSGLVTVIW